MMRRFEVELCDPSSVILPSPLEGEGPGVRGQSPLDSEIRQHEFRSNQAKDIQQEATEITEKFPIQNSSVVSVTSC